MEQEISNFDALDREYERTKPSDALKAAQIMKWGKDRGMFIRDEIALAYHMGYKEGRRSNEERVAKAFMKLYPVSKEDADRMTYPATNDDVMTPDGNKEVDTYGE